LLVRFAHAVEYSVHFARVARFVYIPGGNVR
jgi:hypothetical protein